MDFSIAFVVFSIVRYLSDLYADIRLLRDIEAELYKTQTDLDEKQLQQTFLSLLRDNFGYETVNMFYIQSNDNGKEVLQCVDVANPDHESLKVEVFDLNFGIIGHVAQTGVRYLDNDVIRNRKHSPYRYHRIFASTKAELTVPIKLDENTVGVLDVQSDKSNIFSMEDAVILEDVARRFSSALYYTRITHHIRELFRATYDQVRLEESSETAFQKLAQLAHEHLEADGKLPQNGSGSNFVLLMIRNKHGCAADPS
ncbi:GAF domain-containing protein [Phototrophicus methaneseepsis]|uniref:GAF domain-containing protein n=1 Tax=Phototrophicus methaneseepsis TaxID=2710758 RepID=A0A7S8E7A3_9CHLR|nr:GAF domain-containing protein [Phototrophicus methaneseepsis]QPC81671.1 GAF domain-containing protein [Phototrophicus methaneseepsis]